MGFIDDIYKEIGGSDINQDVDDWLSTGLIELDAAISGRKKDGGVPVGRITEISGAESSNKTALLTKVFVETQRRKGLAVMLDYEHSFSIARGKQFGLSDDRRLWLYKQPNTAEDGFEIIDMIADKIMQSGTKQFVTVGIDSIPAMPTLKEVEAKYSDLNMKTTLGLPMLLSNSLKKLAATINKTNMTLVLINQLRDNPGVMYGPKEKTSGGRALKFYCSVRVKMSKSGKIEDGKEMIGENVNVSVVKNKVFEPFKTAKFMSSFKSGIDYVSTHIDYANRLGLLGDTKGWVVYNDKKMRQKQLAELLNNDKKEYDKFLKMIQAS